MIQQAKKKLRTVFGYEAFRPLQEEIIGQALQGKNALVIMPTGAGKSLCYQIPALLFDGLTIVVSPLISLMKDQVEQLREFEIPAVYLNSSLSKQEYRQNVDRIKRGDVKLLYLAPETLLMPRTLNLLSKQTIDCFTIDEAHCISEWGHDFRPEYRKLAGVRKKLGDTVTMALTATATPRVQEDIKSSLGLKESETFIASFNRKNLFLEIRDKRDPLGQVLEYLQDHQGQSGIIYCFSRRLVEELAEDLSREGYPVRPYHAGLSEDERNRNQEAFIRDDADIIVATIAFGMGINKPDVRFIIHHDLPQNIESYYQQIGRAGRDGLRADCLMLFSYSDIRKIRYFINQKEGREKLVAKRHLNALIDFVENDQCRRIPLMDYFGEVYPSGECDMCDNCITDGSNVEDLTIPAQKFLSCVVRTDQIFGIGHITDVLRGSEARKVKKHGHQNLPTHGIGRDLSKKQWSRLAGQLIRGGYLSRDPEFGGLQLQQSGVDVLKGDEKVYGIIGLFEEGRREQTRAADPVEELDYDSELFKLLQNKRKALADKAEVPPYIIFPNATLIEMAYYFPQQEDSLRTIHGIGDAKLDKYGPAFVKIIKNYCSERGIEERAKTGRNRPRRKKKGNRTRRYRRVGESYNNGRSITSLADEYDVKTATILKHLANYLKEENKLRTDGLLEASILSDDQIRLVEQAFEKLGAGLLRPVYDELKGSIPYEELKLIRLYFLASQK